MVPAHFPHHVQKRIFPIRRQSAICARSSSALTRSDRVACWYGAFSWRIIRAKRASMRETVCIVVIHLQIIGQHTLDAKGLFQRITSKRSVAEDQCVFMRKAFLCQAAPPPFQIPPWTQYTKIRKEGVGNGEIRWPLEEMLQFRCDVEQATVRYESTDYLQRGVLSRGKRHTERFTHQTTEGLSNDAFVEQARSREGYRAHGSSAPVRLP
jgi:hypothetical protein